MWEGLVMPPVVKDVSETLFKQYGPFAFGIISLLMIWNMVVAPELERKNLDFEQMNHLVSQQREVIQQQEKTAVMIRDTALILDRVTQRMQEIVP